MIITIPRRERLEPSVNGILGPKSRVCSSNVDQRFVLYARPLDFIETPLRADIKAEVVKSPGQEPFKQRSLHHLNLFLKSFL